MSVRKEMLDTMTLHVNSLHRGHTMRINHEACPAGEDTRRRFYITRKPDVLLGYCHNCQNSVTKYIAPTDRYRYETFPAAPEPSRPLGGRYKYPLVLDFARDTDSIPIEAKTYMYKYRLTSQSMFTYDIKWSPEHFGIVTPIYHKRETVGHQLRPLMQATSKYVTYMEEDVWMGGFKPLSAGAVDSVPLVLTEDYISAVKVAEAGYLAQCNYGVQVKPEFLHHLAETYNTGRMFIVWLDNDSDHVKEKALEIARILKMFGVKKVYVHYGEKEPKHLTTEELVNKVRSHG